MPEARLLLAAVLALLAALALLAQQPALLAQQPAEPASLARPGYSAITLKSPSSPPRDAALQAAPAAEEQTWGDGVPLSGQRSAALPLVTIGSSLAVVLGLFAALVWVTKKAGPAAARGGGIPDEALRVLGQKSLGPAGSISLVRCGQSLLVLGISATGMQRLAEITDPDQVRNLEAICLGESPSGFAAALSGQSPGSFGHSFGGEQAAETLERKKLFSDRY